MSRAIPVTLIAALAGVHGAAQQRQPETFRSGREVLTIDATVKDASGTPLVDLQAGDFTVRVDGQPRTVLTTRLFGTRAPGQPAATAPVGRFTAVADVPPGRAVVFAVDRDSIRSGGEKATFDAAAAVLDGLTPADAAAAIGLPGRVVDLTRDHAAVADALRAMTGTQPPTAYQHYVTWEEAIAYERGETQTIARVLERECTKDRPVPGMIPHCPPDVAQQAKEMVMQGRAHADSLLSSLTSIIERFRTIRAPKRLVVLSAGIPLDLELLPRYQALAARAAEAHVAISVVHIAQPSFDIANAFHATQSCGGREMSRGSRRSRR